MKNTRSIATLGILALIVLALFATSLMFIGVGQAAPPAAPTPVADFLVGSVQPIPVTFQAATALIADTNTAGVDVMRLGAVDMQYIIDQTIVFPSEMNTTTLTIQYSNDNSNWVDGLVLANANVADATSITRVPVFGRYMRVKQDLTNVNPITITLTAVGR
jgi:hypothetical protein